MICAVEGKLIALTALLVATATARRVSQGPPEQPLVFIAELTGKNVAPGPVETSAASQATAVLIGNRFTVHESSLPEQSAARYRQDASRSWRPPPSARLDAMIALRHV